LACAFAATTQAVEVKKPTLAIAITRFIVFSSLLEESAPRISVTPA
jgi:hypothetical protein